ncbi:MAG: hypothetical protein AAGA12_12780 [Pseudomonadota bacterium]
MPLFLTNLRDSFAAWVRDERGSGAVETVIIMPALAFVYGAVFVWFDAYRSNTLAMKATYTVSDILSRLPEVDESYIDGLSSLMTFLADVEEDPVIRVSSITFDDDVTEGNQYRIDWSYATSVNLRDLLQEDLDLDSSWIPVMGDDETVIVTESFVRYESMFAGALNSDIWNNVMVTRPRFYGKLAKTDEPDGDSDIEIVDDEGDGNPVDSSG